MIYLVTMWLVFGLAGVVDVYSRAKRPFRWGECLLYLLGGPVFYGALAVMFVGGYVITRGSRTSTVGSLAETQESKKYGSHSSLPYHPSKRRRTDPIAA